MSDQDFIRCRVLRGLALNREPGYHFAGNFLDVSFDCVGADDARLSLEAAPHCVESDGRLSVGALAVLADLALAATVRAGLQASTRLATVQMHLQFTGVPLAGRLEAAARRQMFLRDAAGRQGLSQVEVTADGEPACFGSGAFMILKPPKGIELHPMPHRRRGDPEPAPLDAAHLKRDESKVLAHADAAIAAAAAGGGSFVRRFLGCDPHHVAGGASCAVRNGPHIGNRVGHVQGGILLGLAADTACAALPATWMLSSVSAWYISPGEGRTLKIRSKIVHHGRLVSVVRTRVAGKQNRLVLDVTTTHAHRAG